MKKRICFILSHLPQGGAERQTINLIKGLDLNVYEVTLLLYSSREVFYKELFDYNIKIVERKNHWRSIILKNINNALFLWFFLRNNEFDIIHTLLFHNGFWVRLLAPSSYNNKIVYSIRSSLEDSPSFYLKIEKKFIKTSFVVTNSLKSRDQFIKLVGKQFENKVLNIYNGIYIPDIKDKISNKKSVVGTVGRQTKVKNQIQILRVLNKIRYTHDFSFVLIGDSSLDQAKTIQEFITINGLGDIVTVKDAQVNIQEYYDQFDIFILSSLYEGCPNVLFEAMASNVLVICSVGANPDGCITSGLNGYVYDGSDYDLEKKLIEIFNNRNVSSLNSIRRNGRDFVTSKLSMDLMVKSYQKLYLSIVNNG